MMYEVSYSNGEEEGMKNLIYRGLDNSFSFKLPAGDPDRDHKGKYHTSSKIRIPKIIAKTVLTMVNFGFKMWYCFQKMQTK